MEEDEDSEESSDDEDVFAFLPPPTADGYPDQAVQQQQQPDAPPTYPSPIFDPNARYPPPTADVPFTPTSQPLHPFTPQPISPPSTASAHDDNPYRLKRLHSKETMPAPTTTSSRSVKVSLPPGSSEKDLEAGSIVIGKRSLRGTTPGTADTGLMTLSNAYAEPDDESREGSIKMEYDFDAIEEEDSPFPEVRASVSNTDDPDVPALTLRMWLVGLVLCIISRY